MVFPTSSMNELNNKCSKKAAVFFFNRSRWMCSSNMAVFSERTIPDSSHPDCNNRFPSPCTPGPWLRCHLPSSITKSFEVSSSDHQGEIPNPVAHTYQIIQLASACYPQATQGKGEEGYLALLDRLRSGPSSPYSNQGLTACLYSTSSLWR